MHLRKSKTNAAQMRADCLPELLPGRVIAWLPRLRNGTMSNWIKLEKCTVDKQEVIRMASTLGISQEAVVGHCSRFWSWCDDHLKNGVTTLCDTAEVDAIAHLEGFGDAMISVGWLLMEDTIRIPNFMKHLGQSAKNRAKDNARKQAVRAKPGRGSRS